MAYRLLRTFLKYIPFFKSYRFCVYLWLTALFGLSLAGCSTLSSAQNLFKEDEYKKILEMQKQKALSSAEEEQSPRAPEMTAGGYESLGDNYFRQGNTGMAFLHYEKALHLDPERTGIHYKKGILLLSRGLNEQAEKEFQTILAKEPNNALSYEGLGQVSLKAGKLDVAEQHFLQAIKLNDNLWQAHNYLGIIYDRQQRFDEAISHYMACIKIKPNMSIFFNNLGMSYYFRKDYEKAVNAFEEALRIDPANTKTYNNLALALSRLGKYQEAFEAFKKGGDEAAAYNNLGYIYLIKGNYNDAINAFEKAWEINPRFYVRARENLKRAKAASENLSH